MVTPGYTFFDWMAACAMFAHGFDFFIFVHASLLTLRALRVIFGVLQ
jgi:hypothetical protein